MPSGGFRQRLNRNVDELWLSSFIRAYPADEEVDPRLSRYHREAAAVTTVKSTAGKRAASAATVHLTPRACNANPATDLVNDITDPRKLSVNSQRAVRGRLVACAVQHQIRGELVLLLNVGFFGWV